MDIPASIISIISNFLLFLNMAANFLGYVGTSDESPCTKFCNFVQYHTFVKYLGTVNLSDDLRKVGDSFQKFWFLITQALQLP
jgi:hypothetical protein